MKNVFAAVLTLALAGTSSLLGAAEPLEVGGNDTVRTLLAKHKGRTVTLRLKDGGEMTGQVRNVGNFTVHLGALAGKEFFDGVVDLGEVSALVVRTRER